MTAETTTSKIERPTAGETRARAHGVAPGRREPYGLPTQFLATLLPLAGLAFAIDRVMTGLALSHVSETPMLSHRLFAANQSFLAASLTAIGLVAGCQLLFAAVTSNDARRTYRNLAELVDREMFRARGLTTDAIDRVAAPLERAFRERLTVLSALQVTLVVACLTPMLHAAGGHTRAVVASASAAEETAIARPVHEAASSNARLVSAASVLTLAVVAAFTTLFVSVGRRTMLARFDEFRTALRPPAHFDRCRARDERSAQHPAVPV